MNLLVFIVKRLEGPLLWLMAAGKSWVAGSPFAPNSMHASSTTYDVIEDRLTQRSPNVGDGVQYSPWAWEGMALRSKAQSTTNLYVYDSRGGFLATCEIICIYRTTATSEAPLQESPDVSRQPNLFFLNILLDKYNLRTQRVAELWLG